MNAYVPRLQAVRMMHKIFIVGHGSSALGFVQGAPEVAGLFLVESFRLQVALVYVSSEVCVIMPLTMIVSLAWATSGVGSLHTVVVCALGTVIPKATTSWWISFMRRSCLLNKNLTWLLLFVGLALLLLPGLLQFLALIILVNQILKHWRLSWSTMVQFFVELSQLFDALKFI